MLENAPQPIYAYIFQTWEQTREAILELQKNKGQIIKSLGEPAKKMFTYFSAVYYLANKNSTDGFYAKLNQQIINLLDLADVEALIDNPNSQEALANLSIQLVFINAGLNNLENITPYDKEELTNIVSGTFKHYEDIVLVYTLRQALDNQDTGQVAKIILPWLYSERADNSPKEYDWPEVFIYALTLDVVWQAFQFLSEREQEFLLQSYYYQAIVCDVPLREIFRHIFTNIILTTVSKDKQAKMFVKAFEKNDEMIVINFTTQETKQFNILLNNFYALAGSNLGGGFSQEKYINEIFANQSGRAIYSAWLREALNIIVHIKKGDYSF